MTTKKKRGSQASRSALVVLDDVQKRLATIETVDEAKSIIDQAELFRVYAKKAWKGLEVQNHCTYIKLGAERRAGELLAQIEREAGKRDGETSYQAVMRSAELDAMTAHRWQRLARLTVAQLETFWRECDRAGEELTSARVAREFKTQMGPNGDASERERSEGEQVYDAAKTLKQSADRFLQLGCDDESLVLILRDRRYFDSGNVQGLRSSFFALRDRLGVAIGQLTWRMNVKMDEHLDSLTRDSLVAKAERSVEQPSSAGPWYPGGTFPPWDVPNWFDARLKGTPGYYPHALISFHTWHEWQHKPFPEEGFLFGDSGGFSIMTKGVVINPREVIRWQAATCKVGAILDVPPIDSRGNRFFEEGLAGTLSNIKVALPFYREQRAAGTAFRWWGVVQGWTTQELQRWWEQVSRVYPFTDEGEGWALKPRPNITPTSTARVLRFVAQHPEIKRIHLLATTGVGAVATLITLGAASGLELASYDSTTFILMAINRGLLKIDEDGLGWSNESERGGERQLRDYLLETCQCAACTQLRDEVDRYDSGRTRRPTCGGHSRDTKRSTTTPVSHILFSTGRRERLERGAAGQRCQRATRTRFRDVTRARLTFRQDG